MREADVRRYPAITDADDMTAIDDEPTYDVGLTDGMITVRVLLFGITMKIHARFYAIPCILSYMYPYSPQELEVRHLALLVCMCMCGFIKRHT